jgi:serine/threonine-protein kinase
MATEAPLIVGRYALYDKVASGGMATVFIGRLVGPVGFARTVAIKRLHPQFASDQAFVSMFLDEARLAARIQHPNVVSTLDVVATMGELFLVMDYVRGESVSALIRYAKTAGGRIPERVAAAIVSGSLQGLHAAHVATDETGSPLGIVHRDVSPQNMIVGVDGTPRVLDFGVAKAANRLHTTRGGEIKGKISYMPPEQLEGHAVDCRADIYSMGLVLFEMLTGERMFRTHEEVASIARILRNEIVLPGSIDPALAAWDPLIRRATAKDPAQRFPTARAMAIDVERVVGVASTVEVADLVEHLAGDTIKLRTQRIAEIESSSGVVNSMGHAALAEEIGCKGSPALEDVTVEHESVERTTVASAISHAVSVRSVILQNRRRWPIAVVASVAAVGALLAFLFRTASPTAPTVATGGPSESASAALPPPPPGPPPLPPPTSAAESPAASTVSQPAAPATPPPPPVPTTASPAPRPRPVPPQKPAAKPNCERPTTVDNAGHVHFRPECL